MSGFPMKEQEIMQLWSVMLWSENLLWDFLVVWKVWKRYTQSWTWNMVPLENYFYLFHVEVHMIYDTVIINVHKQIHISLYMYIDIHFCKHMFIIVYIHIHIYFTYSIYSKNSFAPNKHSRRVCPRNFSVTFARLVARPDRPFWCFCVGLPNGEGSSIPIPSMYGIFTYIWLFLMVKYGKCR